MKISNEFESEGGKESIKEAKKIKKRRRKREAIEYLVKGWQVVKGFGAHHNVVRVLW